MKSDKTSKGKDLLYVGIGQTAATLLNTIFWLILVFILHPTSYGHLTWLTSIAMLVSTICVFGLGKTIVTYYPKDKDDSLLSSSITLVFITSLIGGTFTAIILHYFVESAFPVFISVLILSFSIFSLAFYTELGKRKYKRYMWLWIGTRTTSLFLPVILYLLFNNITAIIGGLAASYFIFGSWVLRRLKFRPDLKVVKDKLNFSTKAWIANLARASINFLDKILIGILFPGMAILGVYQFSYRIFSLISILPNTLFFYLLPEKSEGRRTYDIEIKGFLLSVFFSVLIYFLAPSITSHVFPDYPEGINAVRIMGFAVIPATLARMKSSERFSTEKAGTVLFSRLFGLVLGITGIVFTFSNGYGLTGLALSMLSIHIGLLIGLVLFPKLRKIGDYGKLITAIVITSVVLMFILSLMTVLIPQIKTEGGYQFSIDDNVENIKEGLDGGELIADARDKFEEYNRNISENVRVNVVENDTWEVNDGQNYYRILVENDVLNVYSKNIIEKIDPLVMDTIAKIQVMSYDEDVGETAIESAFAEVYRIEELMDAEDTSSEIYKLNNAGTEWVNLSTDSINVLKESKNYGELTDGSFDITSKPLVDFWMEEVKESGELPEEDKLKDYLELVNISKLEIDADNNRARFTEENMEVTLGGIAKGYAVDRAIQVLEEHGIEYGYVDIGGDIRVMGPRNWSVGVSDPREEGQNIDVLKLSNEAISTSGDYRRYHLIGEERVHHIIDPRTGRPANRSMSATVVSNTSLEADVLSTAIFIDDEDSNRKILDDTNSRALVVSNDGNITTFGSWVL